MKRLGILAGILALVLLAARAAPGAEQTEEIREIIERNCT